MRQQGDVTKACQTLQASSDNSPSYPGNSVESPGLGNNILEWGKGADNGMDSLYGSMQSEFTNLELRPQHRSVAHKEECSLKYVASMKVRMKSKSKASECDHMSSPSLPSGQYILVGLSVFGFCAGPYVDDTLVAFPSRQHSQVCFCPDIIMPTRRTN